MNFALVKFSRFTEFLPVKQSWGYQSLSLILHPNQYPKVVNSLRVIIVGTEQSLWLKLGLKTIVEKKKKQCESHYQFCFVYQNLFSDDHHQWTFPPLQWFQFMKSCNLWAKRFMKLSNPHIEAIFWLKKSFEPLKIHWKPLSYCK